MPSKTSNEQELIIHDALLALDNDNFDEAAAMLDPLIREGSPEAMFVRAHFQTSNEVRVDPDKFNTHCVELLKKAAGLDHPGALYALSLRLEEGDGIARDPVEARRLLQRSSELEHPHALWRVGACKLYGNSGFEQDTITGLKMIQHAADLKSQGALWLLAELHRSGEFGVAVNFALARQLDEAAEMDDVLEV